MRKACARHAQHGLFVVLAKRRESSVVTSHANAKTNTCLSFLPRVVNNKPQLAAAAASQLLFVILLVLFAPSSFCFFSWFHSEWLLTFTRYSVDWCPAGALQTHRQQPTTDFFGVKTKIAGSSFSHIRYFRLLGTRIHFLASLFVPLPFGRPHDFSLASPLSGPQLLFHCDGIATRQATR
jgi:hypothetical protein